jgi:hypothetical protein
VQSNVAGLLLSVGPLFTLVLSHFLTKDDKFTLIKFISISIGFLGVDGSEINVIAPYPKDFQVLVNQLEKTS